MFLHDSPNPGEYCNDESVHVTGTHINPSESFDILRRFTNRWHYSHIMILMTISPEPNYLRTHLSCSPEIMSVISQLG